MNYADCTKTKSILSEKKFDKYFRKKTGTDILNRTHYAKENVLYLNFSEKYFSVVRILRAY